MQHIEKKPVRSRPKTRLFLALALILALILAVIAWRLLTKKTPVEVPETEASYGELISKEQSEVQRLEVTLQSGESWALVRTEDGMQLEDDPSFKLDSSTVDDLLDASCVVSYSETLADDVSALGDKLDELGLSEPRAVVKISYTDGTSATLRIGSHSDDLDSAYYYMLVDGYAPLYALDVSTADALCVERQLLHAVEQPTIHQARIDSFSIERGGVTYAWQLDGQITDADAEDRWTLVSPVKYPAEGETVTNLRKNMASLRLGAYVAAATEETLAQYGFDAPRMVLTIHQAAGSVGLADDDGVWDTQDYEASTFTLTVGGAKSDVVDYILVDGSIYITSHYSMDVFMSLDYKDTLTRYPVRVSLSNLKSLTIEKDGGSVTYTLDRVEVTDDAGELILDDDGNTQYDVTVQVSDGSTVSWEAFKAAYDTLLVATVSGSLPEDWQSAEDIHTLYTFSTLTGVQHTIGLAKYDALHDAVYTDGCALFYIIRNGLSFEP